MQSSSEEARWISGHLKQLAQKPVLSELSMGVLREKYYLELYSGQSEPSFDFDEFKLSKIYKRSSVRVAKNLQNNPHILIRGEKRGKTYRHKESRPIFNDQMIAEIIPIILHSLGGEASWNQLYVLTVNWAQLLHESYETHPNFLDSLEEPEFVKKNSSQVINIDMETKSPVLIDGLKTIQLAPEIDIDESRVYRRRFPSELKQWVRDAYSNQWWKKSSSNIQSIMKAQGKAGPGSKRGTWLHNEHGSTYPGMYFIKKEKLPARIEERHIHTVHQRLRSSKEINNHIAKIDNRISELFSQLESKRHQIPITQYSEILISEIRELHDISERLLLIKNRISRFTDQVEKLETLNLTELQINSETD